MCFNPPLKTNLRTYTFLTGGYNYFNGWVKKSLHFFICNKLCSPNNFDLCCSTQCISLSLICRNKVRRTKPWSSLARRVYRGTSTNIVLRGSECIRKLLISYRIYDAPQQNCNHTAIGAILHPRNWLSARVTWPKKVCSKNIFVRKSQPKPFCSADFFSSEIVVGSGWAFHTLK